MNQRRLLIGLLLLATLLVDCAVVVTTASVSDPDFWAIPPWALQASQVSLMAIWLGLGKTSAPLRLAGTVGVVAVWAYLDELLTFPLPEEWTVVLMAQAVAVSVPLLVARHLGVEVIYTFALPKAESPTAAPNRWQFSIVSLFGWMTALAVTLSAMQYTARHEFLPIGLVLEPLVVVYLLGRGTLAWTALGAVLGTRRPGMWSIAFGAATVVGVIGLLAVRPHFAGGSSVLCTLALAEGLLLLGSLLVFRVAGYRLKVGRL
jgi:hypothetical protein